MALTTRSIAQRAERNRVLERQWGCVYAANLLPRVPVADEDRPVGYVANTDDDTEPGSHWVAFYFPRDEDDTVEFYDSYGLNEAVYSPHFTRFVKQCRHVKRNTHQFQSLFSDVCGYYALGFLYMRALGASFDTVTRHTFTATPQVNDRFIKRYVNAHMPPHRYVTAHTVTQKNKKRHENLRKYRQR